MGGHGTIKPVAQLQELVWQRPSLPNTLERRLKPGGSGGNNNAGTLDDTEEEEEDTYQGPGKTFGLVLLVVTISLFCVCTFGSIAIGNLWLARKAKRPIAPSPPEATDSNG